MSNMMLLVCMVMLRIDSTWDSPENWESTENRRICGESPENLKKVIRMENLRRIYVESKVESQVESQISDFSVKTIKSIIIKVFDKNEGKS